MSFPQKRVRRRQGSDMAHLTVRSPPPSQLHLREFERLGSGGGSGRAGQGTGIGMATASFPLNPRRNNLLPPAMSPPPRHPPRSAGMVPSRSSPTGEASYRFQSNPPNTAPVGGRVGGGASSKSPLSSGSPLSAGHIGHGGHGGHGNGGGGGWGVRLALPVLGGGGGGGVVLPGHGDDWKEEPAPSPVLGDTFPSYLLDTSYTHAWGGGREGRAADGSDGGGSGSSSGGSGDTHAPLRGGADIATTTTRPQQQHNNRTLQSFPPSTGAHLQHECLPGCLGSDGALHKQGHHVLCIHYITAAPAPIMVLGTWKKKGTSRCVELTPAHTPAQAAAQAARAAEVADPAGTSALRGESQPEMDVRGWSNPDLAMKMIGAEQGAGAVERVECAGCYGLTDLGVAYLAENAPARLRHLDLSDCAQLTDVSLEFLAEGCG